MKYQFSDMVDIEKLRKLLEGFYIATGIPSGILDNEGNILVAVGWHDICLKYHRAKCETELLCRQSNIFIAQTIKDCLDKGEQFICHKCENGLYTIGEPIIIDGIHIANIFRGQFLLEKPDVEQFRLHAQMYGFDEEGYLSTLDKVPILSIDELKSAMTYFSELAQILAEMGLNKLKLLEAKEKVLQESEERLKTIIDNTPNPIQSYDIDGNIMYWNKASENLYGWMSSETLGKKLDEFMFEGDSAKKFLKVLKEVDDINSSVGPLEWNLLNKAGAEKSVYSTIFPIFLNEGKKEYISIEMDVTERKRHEKEMTRFDQLNLLGEMAASIAHEIRNPLTTVRGFLQIFKEKNHCNQYKENFELMISELDRANSIITEFLSLAKNKAMKLEKKNLNSIINAMVPLIEANLISNNQYLSLELKKIPEIFLDENEIRQLILNLVHNGMEAMCSGGCLTIKTHIENNDEVVLLVQDQGHGIKPEIIEKLGTPFFSTKENGTGLGLAVCYSIASRHKAEISVKSGNEGTTFFIRFKL